MNARQLWLPALAGVLLSSCAHRSTLSAPRASTPEETAALLKAWRPDEQARDVSILVKPGETINASDHRPAKVLAFRRRNERPVVHSQDRKEEGIQVDSIHVCDVKFMRDGHVWTEPMKVGVGVSIKDGVVTGGRRTVHLKR